MSTTTTTLEDVVDEIGLAATLAMLADICDQKVRNCRHGDGDEATARTWVQACTQLDAARRSTPVQNLAQAYGHNVR